MQRSITSLAVALALGFLFAGRASAALYLDSTGEEFSGNSNLDISSVEVTNDATSISFKVNLVGDIQATNWGKYMVGIDSVPGGDTSATGNGWIRPISISSGMDYWIGSWVDGGGGRQVWKYTGTWGQLNQVAPLATIQQFSVTLTADLADLGLADGSVIKFDVYSGGGGGGDSANDASSNPLQSTNNWGGPYDSGNNLSTYTVVVPEPTTVGLLGIPALAGLLRRRTAK
jgi:hypothetical protein